MKKPRIVNHGDWFLASVLERFQREGEDVKNDLRRCVVFENTYLVQAANLAAAYDKAAAIGREECRNISPCKDESGHSGKWIYDGISELIPVCEDIEDESEILWAKHAGITVRKAKTLAKQKKEWIRLRKTPK
jgi:hypothetical protein